MDVLNNYLSPIIFSATPILAALLAVNSFFTYLFLFGKKRRGLDLNSIIEEYKKIQAQDFKLNLEPLPQTFTPVYKVIAILLFGSLLIWLMVFIPDQTATPAQHTILQLLALGIILSAWGNAIRTYQITFTQNAIEILPLVSWLPLERREFPYTEITNCQIILKTQTGRYGRYGIFFQVIITDQSGITNQFTFNNFETPVTRIVVAYLLSLLGKSATLDYQGFK
jgi:hypothetical protein